MGAGNQLTLIRHERWLLGGIDRLAPRELAPGFLRAWLATPLAGRPLFERILEGVGIRAGAHIDLIASAATEALADLLSELGTVTVRVVSARAAFRPVAKDQRVVHLAGLPLPLTRYESLRYEALPGVAYNVAAGQVPERVGSWAQQEQPLWCVHCDTAPALLELAQTGLLTGQHFWKQKGTVTPRHLLVGDRAAVCATIDVGPRMAGRLVASIGSDTFIDHRVTLAPGAIIGAGCFISEGALISNAMVLDGTYIAPRDTVVGCVMWKKERFPADKPASDLAATG